MSYSTILFRLAPVMPTSLSCLSLPLSYCHTSLSCFSMPHQASSPHPFQHTKLHSSLSTSTRNIQHNTLHLPLHPPLMPRRLISRRRRQTRLIPRARLHRP